MTLYTGISARHVNSYHQSNGLLFQFILVEFIEIFSEIQHLDSLRNNAPMFVSTNEKSCNRNLSLIEDSLVKLVGPANSSMRLFSWNFNEGLLMKLRTYCTLFLQNSETDEKELIAIQQYSDKIWQGCLQAFEAFHGRLPDNQLLLTALDKINASMQRFAKQIARLIHQFRDDENVIFYIIRNHKIFDKLYGNRFIAKLLSRIYPKGLKEVQFLLIKKYTERGFENVLPVIYSSIKEIEASSL